METILFVAHPEADTSVSSSTLEALTAAQNLAKESGGTLVVGLIGSEIETARKQLGGSGAARFLAVIDPALAQSRYATDAAAAEALCRAAEATMVIAPATARWNRVLAGVAQRLGGAFDSEALPSAQGDTVSISRWFYRQRMQACLTRTARPWILTVSPGTFPAASSEGQADWSTVSVDLPSSRTEVTGVSSPDADQQTIRPDAEFLLVAGAGWTKKQPDGQLHVKDAEEHILNFLNVARASLGSSKSMVDLASEGQEVLSFMSHLHQIGQTGSTPRHKKGLATCCHGEEPHAVGWRFIQERRAINLNPNCGWAQGKADVLYVADAFEVMDKVNQLLE
jgi:electron transfer flavoprotein alpha subunit